MTLLESVPSHPWLINVFSNTMVLESETSVPSQIDDLSSQPISCPIP